MNKRLLSGLVVPSLLLSTAYFTPAWAVSDGAPQSRASLLVGSARSCGMGEMTTIVDDGAVAIWWNPGMIALDRRIQANVTTSKLAEGLADDIRLWTFNLHGGLFDPEFGIAGGFGYTYLDLGESDIITEEGDQIGSFSSADHLFNLVVGGSALDMIGFGLALEYSYSKLSPQIRELGIDDGTGTALSISLGVVAKPEFRFGSSGVSLSHNGRDEPAFFISPVAGISILHYGSEIVYNDQNQPEDLPRQFHTALGLSIGFDQGSGVWGADLRRLLRANLFLGAEYDKSLVGSKDDIGHYGAELRLAGILSLRGGYVDDHEGRIEDHTWGIGLGNEELLPVGVRIDYARVPQAEDLPRVHRWEFMVSLRPELL
ncbi:MAG: hypothetical protein ABIK65_10985 [Candidatus Eisenbacteria bacterium]